MLQAWKQYGCTTVAGYIIGFPADTYQNIAHDIEILKRELPIDLLEFFILTPLPGSEDHQRLSQAGVWMDPDMNKYDLEHPTVAHPLMTHEEWSRAYRMAWRNYYTWEHMETIMRRAAASGEPVGKVMFFLLCFYGCIMLEQVHPLEGGLFRRKRPSTRRPGLVNEPVWSFYVKRAHEVLTTGWQWCQVAWKLNQLRRKIENDPSKGQYSDVALTAAGGHSEDYLDLHQTYGSLLGIKRLTR